MFQNQNRNSFGWISSFELFQKNPKTGFGNQWKSNDFITKIKWTFINFSVKIEFFGQKFDFSNA